MYYPRVVDSTHSLILSAVSGCSPVMLCASTSLVRVVLKLIISQFRLRVYKFSLGCVPPMAWQVSSYFCWNFAFEHVVRRWSVLCERLSTSSSYAFSFLFPLSHFFAILGIDETIQHRPQNMNMRRLKTVRRLMLRVTMRLVWAKVGSVSSPIRRWRLRRLSQRERVSACFLSIPVLLLLGIFTFTVN